MYLILFLFYISTKTLNLLIYSLPGKAVWGFTCSVSVSEAICSAWLVFTEALLIRPCMFLLHSVFVSCHNIYWRIYQPLVLASSHCFLGSNLPALLPTASSERRWGSWPENASKRRAAKTPPRRFTRWSKENPPSLQESR